jgi:hypothetical protein
MLSNNLTLDEEDAVQRELLQLQADIVCTHISKARQPLTCTLLGGAVSSSARVTRCPVGGASHIAFTRFAVHSQ